LIRATGIENSSKYSEQSIKMRKERSAAISEEVEDGPEDRSVLEIIIFKRKDIEKRRKNLLQRNSSSIPDNQASDSTSCIVLSIELGC